MTIAACYISPEGLVLGADSTTTYGGPGGDHYFNNAQKLFEIGDGSSLGAICWGLGGLHVKSYRTLFAILDDELKSNPPVSVNDVAERWTNQFWDSYIDQNFEIGKAIATCKLLNAKKPFNASAKSPDPLMRTSDEEKLFTTLSRTLVAGFCIAGYVPSNREPSAFAIIFGSDAVSMMA